MRLLTTRFHRHHHNDDHHDDDAGNCDDVDNDADVMMTMMRLNNVPMNHSTSFESHSPPVQYDSPPHNDDYVDDGNDDCNESLNFLLSLCSTMVLYFTPPEDFHPIHSHL